MDFVSLPSEIRYCVYDYLFVSHTDGDSQKYIHLLKSKAPKPPIGTDSGIRKTLNQRVDLTILQTCKQIRDEALQFFLQNIFLIQWPENGLDWLFQLGHFNIQHIKSIQIDVSWHYDCSDNFPWYPFLDKLAQEAVGLRHLYVYWGGRGTIGAGKDLVFVRKLAKIRNLQTMVIGGFYAMHWPSYLSEKLGVRVVEDEHPKGWDYTYRCFQQDTEDLIP